MDRAARLAMFQQVDVYPVTCERLSWGRTNLEVLQGVIAGGARIIQLREKDISRRELYQMAEKFRAVTAAARVLLIINDHLDIAMGVGADGVHLGQDDLPIPAARLLAPHMILGASTHSLEEALRAQEEGADYINIGPIFPTETKEGVAQALGPDAIRTIGTRVEVPFTVMGGINQGNIDRVIAKGATKVAMVTAITQAEDIGEAVRDLRNRIRSGPKGEGD